MRKVLISGISGMLGADFQNAFAGDQIYGIDLKEPQKYNKEFISLDITEGEKLYTMMPRINPDIIIHAAAYTSVDRAEEEADLCFKINALGTRNMVQAAQRFDIPFLYISTDYIFDGKKDSPYCEFDQPHPLNIYGQSKYWGEIFVRDHLQKFWIVRSSWLYGHSGPNFVETILKMAGQGKPLKIVDEQNGSPTSTKDLAGAVKKLIDEAGFGLYHVTNSDSCSWYEFGKKILELTGNKCEIIPIKNIELNRPARRPENSVLKNYHWILNGFKPLRSWKEALKDYLEER